MCGEDSGVGAAAAERDAAQAQQGRRGDTDRGDIGQTGSDVGFFEKAARTAATTLGRKGGATIGAKLGSAFGPVGAVLGAVAGGVFGERGFTPGPGDAPGPGGVGASEIRAAASPAGTAGSQENATVLRRMAEQKATAEIEARARRAGAGGRRSTVLAGRAIAQEERRKTLLGQ